MKNNELILLYLVTNAFRTYVIFKFLRLFWERESTGRLAEFTAYFIFYTAVSVSYLRLNIPIVTLAVNIGGLLLVSCIYRVSWKSRIFAIVFCYAVLMCTEIIVTSFWGYISFNIFSTNQIDTANLTVAATLLPFIVVLILNRTKRFKKTGDISSTYCLAAVFIPTSSIYLTAIIVKNAQLSSDEVLPIAVLLALNILIFYLYDRAMIIEQKKREEEILKSQNQYYRFQYELMRASLENTKTLRHDLKNHWTVINGFLEKNEAKRASDYAAELISYTYGEGEYARSGCLEIDCIINFKLQQAAVKGINAKLTLDVPANIKADPAVIAVVLGNLLDNAVEAADKSRDKWIKVSVKYKKGLLYLDIENSYDGVLLPDYKSRKENPTGHGIGLANATRATRENHGVLKLSHDEKVFYASVFFYLNQEESGVGPEETF